MSGQWKVVSEQYALHGALVARQDPAAIPQLGLEHPVEGFASFKEAEVYLNKLKALFVKKGVTLGSSGRDFFWLEAWPTKVVVRIEQT
jgi:hypothetical protein